MATNSTQNITPKTFGIVRYALLGGVVFFALILWYLPRLGATPAPLDDETATLLRYVFYVVATGAAVGILLMRQKAAAALTFALYVQRAIAGLALAEGVAVFGGVYWLLTGIAVPFFLGLLLFLIAFFAFPSHPPEA